MATAQQNIPLFVWDPVGSGLTYRFPYLSKVTNAVNRKVKKRPTGSRKPATSRITRKTFTGTIKTRKTRKGDRSAVIRNAIAFKKVWDLSLKIYYRSTMKIRKLYENMEKNYGPASNYAMENYASMYIYESDQESIDDNFKVVTGIDEWQTIVKLKNIKDKVEFDDGILKTVDVDRDGNEKKLPVLLYSKPRRAAVRTSGAMTKPVTSTADFLADYGDKLNRLNKAYKENLNSWIGFGNNGKRKLFFQYQQYPETEAKILEQLAILKNNYVYLTASEDPLTIKLAEHMLSNDAVKVFLNEEDKKDLLRGYEIDELRVVKWPYDEIYGICPKDKKKEPKDTEFLENSLVPWDLDAMNPSIPADIDTTILAEEKINLNEPRTCPIYIVCRTLLVALIKLNQDLLERAKLTDIEASPNVIVATLRGLEQDRKESEKQGPSFAFEVMNMLNAYFRMAFSITLKRQVPSFSELEVELQAMQAEIAMHKQSPQYSSSTAAAKAINKKLGVIDGDRVNEWMNTPDNFMIVVFAALSNSYDTKTTTGTSQLASISNIGIRNKTRIGPQGAGPTNMGLIDVTKYYIADIVDKSEENRAFLENAFKQFPSILESVGTASGVLDAETLRSYFRSFMNSRFASSSRLRDGVNYLAGNRNPDANQLSSSIFIELTDYQDPEDLQGKQVGTSARLFNKMREILVEGGELRVKV